MLCSDGKVTSARYKDIERGQARRIHPRNERNTGPTARAGGPPERHPKRPFYTALKRHRKSEDCRTQGGLGKSAFTDDWVSQN